MTTDKPTPRRRRLAEAELVEALLANLQRSTEFMANLAGQLVNDTLEVFTGTIPTPGYFHRGYHVAVGAIEVNNTSDTDITVTSAGPSGTAPPGGVGVYVVKAGTCRTVALASRQFTLYGTAGKSFSYQTFTAAIRPATGGGG